MAERVKPNRDQEPAVDACPGWHEHVIDPERAGRTPGPLAEWRRRNEWEAKVVFMARPGDEWVTVERWLPAELVERTS